MPDFKFLQARVPVPGREERMEIMAEMIEKRSIVHHQVSAKDNFFEEGQKGKESEAKRTDESLRAAEKAKKNSRPNSWKEAAAAAGVTLVEAGEPLDDEVLLKKKSLKEMISANHV